VALGAILASGAAAAAQISATVVFVVVALVIVEIPLISYLMMPAKTQVVALQLHNLARARRRQILAVIVGVAGLILVATGIGTV
jgi:hypothetical protein